MHISLDGPEPITPEEIIESYTYDPIIQVVYNICCTLHAMARNAHPEDVRKMGLILDVLKS